MRFTTMLPRTLPCAAVILALTATVSPRAATPTFATSLPTCSQDLNACYQLFNTPQPNQAQFFNYDTEGSPDNPVTLLFINNSSTNKVQAAFTGAGYYYCGPNNGNCSTATAYYYENSAGYSNTDQGYKHGTPTCSSSNWDTHARIYGFYQTSGSTYALYDPGWGWFNFATTHIDVADVSNCSYTQYGWQEEAAKHIWNDIIGDSHFNASQSHQDWVYLSNWLSSSDSSNPYNGPLYSSGPCGGRFNPPPYSYNNYGYWNGNHCEENDGSAAWIYVN
jgi:hypothetical protein